MKLRSPGRPTCELQQHNNPKHRRSTGKHPEGVQMTYKNLGKLERIDLREVWNNETDDFTPWLATQANLDDLSETLGMQLELHATE